MKPTVLLPHPLPKEWISSFDRRAYLIEDKGDKKDWISSIQMTLPSLVQALSENWIASGIGHTDPGVLPPDHPFYALQFVLSFLALDQSGMGRASA